MSVEDLRTERTCPRCRYTIYPGAIHVEQPQPEGSTHVVCSLKVMPGVSLRGPVVEVIAHYLTENEGAP